MALFYFILKVGRQTFPDPAGEEFDDVAGARLHAHAVARELMASLCVQLAGMSKCLCQAPGSREE